MKSKSHPPLRLLVPISLDEAVSISHLIFAFRDSLGSDESIAQVAWSGKFPALKLIPGGGESWRSKLKARLRPTLLFILVATSIFVVARSVSSALRPDVARQAHSEVAAIVQRAASQQSAGRSQAWIEGGWQELRQRQGNPGANSETEGAKLRRLDRQIDSLEPGPDQQHLRGLLALKSALQNGDPSAAALREAEQEILEVLEKEPERAGAWNDLAAVYLTWAEQHDRPRLLLDAFAATHAALEQQSDFAEARFNQAKALEELGLFQPAAAALDFDWPDWADRHELQQRRIRLEATDPVALRESYLEELEKIAESGGIARFLGTTERFPPTALRWVEEILLPRWGGELGKGNASRAEALLALARGFGDRIANPPKTALLSDPMLEETVAAIDRAASRGDTHGLAGLARGHEAFGQGMTAFPGNLARAQASFQEAEKDLEAGGSPFAAWAVFYQGACIHLLRNVPRAMALFDRLSSPGQHFPNLQVRLGWGRGLILGQFEKWREALSENQATLALATELQDFESAAAIGYLEAESEAALALDEATWRSQVRALRSAEVPLRARYRVGILFTGASRSSLGSGQLKPLQKPKMETGLLELRRLFQVEALRVAQLSGNTNFVVENRNWLAATLDLQGRPQEAAEQRSLASASISALPDPILRERYQAEAILAAARSGVSPVSANELESAASIFRRHKLLFRLVDVNLVSAQRAEREGEAAARAEWLDEAQRVVESAASGLGIEDRNGYLAALPKVFRSQIALALEGSGDAEKALELYLREQVLRRQAVGMPAESGSDFSSNLDLSNVIPKQLPPEAVFVVFLELPDDKLAVILEASGGTVAKNLSLSRTELAEKVTALRQAIEAANSGADQSATAAADLVLKDLSHQLIEPLEDRLPASGRLGLALDEVFARIPFGALFAGSLEQRLVERFEITRLGTPEYLSRRPLPFESPDRGALVIGASDPAASWRLENLKSVDEEAESIRLTLGLRDDQLLFGPFSTRQRVLGALAEARWFHFAGHSLESPANPAQSLLILAADGADSTALSIQDLVEASHGRLEMAILAGCETARSGTGGLAQALERSGVPITIGSLWPVADEITAQFFKGYYQLLAAGVPPGQAHREIQLTALRSRDSRLASVAAWAAFAVFSGNS